MNKRALVFILTILLCLCILGASIGVGYLVWRFTVEKDKQEILDNLRDQLKNPVTIEVTEEITEPMTDRPTRDESESHETGELVTAKCQSSAILVIST